MTIEEFRSKKQTLSGSILMLISEFEKETKVPITNIQLNIKQGTSQCEYLLYPTYERVVEVETNL